MPAIHPMRAARAGWRAPAAPFNAISHTPLDTFISRSFTKAATVAAAVALLLLSRLCIYDKKKRLIKTTLAEVQARPNYKDRKDEISRVGFSGDSSATLIERPSQNVRKYAGKATNKTIIRGGQCGAENT